MASWRDIASIGARVLWVLVLAASCAGDAAAGPSMPAGRGDPQAQFVADLRRLMGALRAGSRADAVRIRAAYGDLVHNEILADRNALAAALASGSIVPLRPGANRWLGITVRQRGVHPIGELDLGYQQLYVAARPETIECLRQVAASVHLAPLEITSLVRHRAYQQALGRANANARTDLALHAAGLAFDVSVLNLPLRATRELRDVLLAKRAAGDLYFIAETHQFVFHVVPAPARRDEYASVAAAVGNMDVGPAAVAWHPERVDSAAAADTPVLEAGMFREVGIALTWAATTSQRQYGTAAMLALAAALIVGGVVAGRARRSARCDRSRRSCD